jgi:predicted nucleic acid-binding protein
VLPLARRHQLSAYDAVYLELALRAQAPLATFDEALGRAALREGVEVRDGTAA